MIHEYFFTVQDYGAMVKAPMGGFQRWFSGDLTSFLKYHESSKLVRTLRDRDKIVAIMGAHIVYQGVCEVFFIPSLGWEKHLKSVMQIAKNNCVHLSNVFRRVQALCLAKSDSLRFLEFLGFEVEGLLTDYDQFNNDYFILRYRGRG